MNPVLRQRKTGIVQGWLARDSGETSLVTLFECDDEDQMPCKTDILGYWWSFGDVGEIEHCWSADEFKALYTGIPRKGRAVYVQIEIVV